MAQQIAQTNARMKDDARHHEDKDKMTFRQVRKYIVSEERRKEGEDDRRKDEAWRGQTRKRARQENASLFIEPLQDPWQDR